MTAETFSTGVISLAALSIAGKIAYDIRTEHQIRRSIAAGLLGELKAYERLLNAPDVAMNARLVAGGPREARIEWLKAWPTLPSGHPVFDKVADKIGLISPEAAQRVSEAYNMVTGMRLLAAFKDPSLLQGGRRP